MLKIGLIATLTAIAPIQAKQWATGDCTLDNGEKLYYAVHNSRGFIAFEDGGRRDAFSDSIVENGVNFGIIRHIGPEANLTLAVNLGTGRGYLIIRNDNGKETKGNAYCNLAVKNQ
jgi:hypothetical protein